MVEFYDPVEDKLIRYHLNSRLQNNLDKLNERRMKGDRDYVWVIDGAEGSGKSVLAMQLAKYLNPEFSLKDVCFSPEEFRKVIQNAKKGDVVIFDEAFIGLSSRSALSTLNKMLVSLMMQMRQRNLFVFIVLPSIFLLDKYVALFRSKALLHVYILKNQKRMWTAFNTKHKKHLILEGRQTMSYAPIIKKDKLNFKGNFYNTYTINEEAYRKKKLEAFQKAEESEEYNDIVQRNKLVCIFNQEYDLNSYQMADLFKKYEFSLSRSSIQVILQRLKNQKEDGKND